MKVAAPTALLAALAASASAEPLRAITLHPAPPPFSAEEVSVRASQAQAQAQAEVVEVVPVPHHQGHAPTSMPKPIGMPCHGGGGPGKPGRFDALLASLGLVPKPDGEGGHHSSAVRSSVLKHWKEHMEAILHGAEDKVTPILQGGNVKVLPVAPVWDGGDRTPEIKWWRSVGKGRWLVKDGAREWRAPRDDEVAPGRGRMVHGEKVEMHGQGHGLGEGPKHRDHSHGHGHGHVDSHEHRFAKSAVGRLYRALKNLRPHESIILAFVIGAGLGSILHFFFMLFLLSLRHFGLCGPRSTICRSSLSREERRARRQARKEAKKARKAERKFAPNGQIRLEGQESLPGHGQAESLPAYEEGESQRLLAEKEEQA